jgi:DNA polymerase-3 subunit alpha
MKIKKIKKIKKPINLIDIGVEQDHTFCVSNEPNGSFYLTHNSFPDIDSDVSDRDKALEILSDFFGEENVIPVSNFNQLQMRSLVKDVCRINGVSFEESNEATKKIETETKAAARKEPGFDATQWFLTFEAAMEDSPTFRELIDKYPDFERTIKILFKNNRNVSRHAGGVIITADARKNMPIIKSGGVLQTPWTEGANYRHLETFGFLKFDVLALGTLRMFENCIRRILKKQGNKYPTFKDIKQFYYDNLHPINNPMDDMKVYKTVYWQQNYAGVFQFVREQVQQMMAKTKPKSIEDIAIITSLYRPGPLSVKADKTFLANRKSPSKIKYKHLLLRKVLKDTSGLIIFQEQLQMIYHNLIGIPLDETDAVRKAFTKKDISNKEEAEQARQKLRREFMDGCLDINKIPHKVSSDIFDEMERYVKYSFNKSHAVSYAVISWMCAWFLTYYPDEWIATYIDYCVNDKGKVSGYDDPKAVALQEARALGYEIGKPDINSSQREFEVSGNGILVPSFSSLKSVGLTALGEIDQYRPYKTLEDLLWNADNTWRHSKFNKRAMGTLVKLGAFETMELVGEDKQFKNYRQLHHVLVDNADLLKRAISRKKQTHKEVLAALIEEAQELPDWTMAEKVKFSKDLAGSVDLDLIVTPELRKYLAKEGIYSIDKWTNEKDPCWAVVDSCTVAATKKTGKKFLRIRLYGESGATQTCFIWSYREGYDLVIPSNTLVIANFKKSNFGFSTYLSKLEVLEAT